MNFVVFGTHPLLSIAELHALGSHPKITRFSSEIALIDGETPAPYFVERTGGVLKAGRIVENLSRWDMDKAAEMLAGYLSSNPEDRPVFGVSVYDAGDYKIASAISQMRDKLGLAIKRILKSNGIPCRYASSKERALSSVFVTTNNLVEKGADFCLIAHADGVSIGMTEAVQDFKAWSERDYGRPSRDAGSGMLPPKLARMLVNLSGVQAQETLLDPFCGSGTVLMEAALMEMKHVIGTDLSPKAIKDSEKNLQWLLEHKWISEPLPKTFVCPSEELPAHIKEPVDAVAGETYLGPPQSGNETVERRRATREDLIARYKKMFVGMHAVMKPGTKAAIAFPAFKIPRGHEFLPLKNLLETIGFEVLDPLPAGTPAELGTLTPNKGLLYERENQKTARDIILMRKK